MVDRITIQRAIDEAIQSGSSLYIRYRDYHGNISERRISPLEWVEPGKLLAHCHLRNDQRNFNLNNILDISGEPFTPPETTEKQLASKNSAQVGAPRITPRPNRTPPMVNTPKPAFSRVKSADEWGRLLGYFRECLNYEYQHQFSFNRSDLYIWEISDELAYSFLAGRQSIELRFDSSNDRLRAFLDNSHRRNQQLCLGKSFVYLNAEKISPLLFIPVTMEKGISNTVIFKPEEYSLSYAALMNLGFDADEIADFLNCFSTFIENQPSLEEIEEFVTQSLSARLSRPLPVFSHEDYSLATIADYSIFDGTGLFWANSEFTGNLIAELQELRADGRWLDAPEPLEHLLNGMPEHEHAPAPDFVEDDQFYVTNINEQQRKAARAVAEHTVTIVTGPPGTGKSQLVLNLIAQAYLEGKKVLFASHNNKAVDVVMDRLQEETRFQGAIRTGNSANRKRTVEQMESAIAQVHRPAIGDLENRYRAGKQRLKQTNDQLNLIRDLHGKIRSYQLEREQILERLTDSQREQFAGLQLPFIEEDKIQINALLSNLAEDLRALTAERQKLIGALREVFADREEKYPAIQVIREYERQWGHFAGGMLHPDAISSLAQLLEYCQAVRQLLACIAAKKEWQEAQRSYHELKQAFDAQTERLTDEQNGAVLLLENYSQAEFEQIKGQTDQWKTDLQRIAENQFSFFQKIAIVLHLFNPQKELSKAVTARSAVLGMKATQLASGHVGLPALQQAVEALAEVVKAAELMREIQRLQKLIAQTQAKFQEASEQVLKDYLDEFGRLNLASFELESLPDILREVEEKARANAEKLMELLKRIRAIFIHNIHQIPTLEALQRTTANMAGGAFGLSAVIDENQAFAWVRLWQKVVALWEANAVIQHSEDQLASLPKEEAALAAYQEASQALFSLAGDLMRATWFRRAGLVSNAVFEGTKNYISAVRQLSELDYGRDPGLYNALKAAERRNFPFALEMFPVWAITNLTAKTNFPLDAGLFDLVIIDEASQCDIPSAIPLLYRAKKVVIIGDPNQLRHVATLPANLDKQIGQKYGIGLDAFSYVTHSLYDLGEKSVGFHPGPILLNEHYRSDPRIVSFSNEEFYENQLIIKTDLTRRGYPKEFLNKRGGACWLKVPGHFRRPPNGSGYNDEELKQVALLVPQLLTTLDRDGYRNVTVGIVTPFRAQETRLREWLGKTFPGNPRIKTGTAHQFQGDECDVILFSPVLADGIPEGTLNWLEDTYNLLNVAITRARVSLIIVGDFNFCYGLPAKNRYHRLARYIHDRLHGVVEKISELPLLNGERVELLGALLDPSNPEANRTNLIRFIESCQEYIYWVDPYFDQGIVDLFDELYDDGRSPKLKQIRLMTAERQVKSFYGKPPSLRPDSIVRLKEYLKTKGVDFAMRILPGEELPHDRFLYYPAGAINMPPFAGAFGKHRHLSEYTPSRTTVENFNEYWNKGKPIEDY